MANIFFASDHHFGHKNILTFTNFDGTPVRTFSSVEEMNEVMVENHNRVVKPHDKVYFLGDVCFKNGDLDIVGRMNGDKVLIKGNHDELKPSRYLEYFRDIRMIKQFKGFAITHIPLHPDCLERWGFNIHGHLHTNKVKDAAGVPDPRYINVSMEQINFTPISFEDVKLRAERYLDEYRKAI